ncbi:hypothetical protein QBC43DRAFT_294530 [Cladorrhinum sp. PSN259]|nr:hypothetical protein QBC43DRAFT_294530 [Cladorrhinum sp. PSN259]
MRGEVSKNWTARTEELTARDLWRFKWEPNMLRFEPMFDVETSSTMVTIIVGYLPTDSSSSYTPCDAFRFCENQMTTLYESTDTLTSRAFTPSFQQVTLDYDKAVRSGDSLAKQSGKDTSALATADYNCAQRLGGVGKNERNYLLDQVIWRLRRDQHV